MRYLPGIDDEESPMKSIVKTAASKAAWRVLAIGLVIVIVAGVFWFINFKKGIEVKVRVEYEAEILELENKVAQIEADGEQKLTTQKESYEEKLAHQKEDYEKKITSIQEKHNKEIEKKDADIERLEVESKISFDEIEADIKNVGKLTTIDYHYTYAGTHEDVKKFFKTDFELAFTKNSFIAQWDGVVAIGIDLAKVKISVNETNKTINIAIPKAEIFYHDIDHKSFKVLDQQNNIFNPITVEDVNQFDINYEEKIYEKIEKNRMLDDAYKNGQVMVENILKAVPTLADKYTINFQ